MLFIEKFLSICNLGGGDPSGHARAIWWHLPGIFAIYAEVVGWRQTGEISLTVANTLRQAWGRLHASGRLGAMSLTGRNGGFCMQLFLIPWESGDNGGLWCIEWLP